ELGEVLAEAVLTHGGGPPRGRGLGGSLFWFFKRGGGGGGENWGLEGGVWGGGGGGAGAGWAETAARGRVRRRGAGKAPRQRGRPMLQGPKNATDAACPVPSFPRSLAAVPSFLWTRLLFPGTTKANASRRWLSLFILLIVPVALLYPCLAFHLFEPDEGRY